MFDPPSQVKPMSAMYRPALQSQTDETLTLARRAARESFVLLKNDRAALPLDRDAFVGRPHSLALVGPQADDWRLLLGAANYAPSKEPSKGIVTILQGLQHALTDSNLQSALVTVPGCVNITCQDADLVGPWHAARDASASIVILGDQFGS